jgi:hypothetical protein
MDMEHTVLAQSVGLSMVWPRVSRYMQSKSFLVDQGLFRGSHQR